MRLTLASWAARAAVTSVQDASDVVARLGGLSAPLESAESVPAVLAISSWAS